MTFEQLKQMGLLGYAIQESKSEIGLILFGLCFLLAAIGGYLLGSVNCGLLISRLTYKDDIRNHGSGNAGMTNVMRTYGKKAAALTFLGDGLKAAIAVYFGLFCCGTYGAYLAALLCAVGHAFPIYFGFRGGKGVVVTAVSILCLNPLVFLVLFIMFVAIVAITKFISAGSIMCMLMYPLLLSSLSKITGGSYLDTTSILGEQIEPGRNLTVVIAFLNAVFVIWLHRSNIKRLMEGKENKFSFKKSVPAPAKGEETAPAATEMPAKAPAKAKKKKK